MSANMPKPAPATARFHFGIRTYPAMITCVRAKRSVAKSSFATGDGTRRRNARPTLCGRQIACADVVDQRQLHTPVDCFDWHAEVGCCRLGLCAARLERRL